MEIFNLKKTRVNFKNDYFSSTCPNSVFILLTTHCDSIKKQNKKLQTQSEINNKK